MNPFALSGLLTGLSSVGMGLFVLSRDPANKLNRLWFLFTGSVAIWGFGGMWIAMEGSEPQAILAWRVAFSFGVVWIPILFYHFVSVFCDLKNRTMLLANYLVAALFFPLILFSKLFFSGVRPAFSSFYYSIPGSVLFHLFFLWWVWLVLYTHYQVFERYRRSSGIKRNQYAYFFVAFALAYFFGSLDYFPIYGVDIYPYGNFGIMFYPIVMTYAILRYRALDITVVIHKGLVYVVLLALVLVPTIFGILISQRTTLYSLPPVMAGGLIFACGLWIILRNPRAVPNLTFGLVCLGVCIWLFSVFLMYSASNPSLAEFWGKFTHVGSVLIPAFFFHFSNSFLQRQKRFEIWACYLISGIFLFLIPTTLLINGQHRFPWGYYPKAGPLHPVFLAYFASASGYSLFKLYHGFKEKRESNAQEATRIKYIFWAFVIGFIASIDYFQMYGFTLYPTGFIFVSLWVIVVTYAIARFQLLDITIIFTRSQFLASAQILSVVPLYILIVLLIRSFVGEAEYILSGVLLTSFLILAGHMGDFQGRIEKMLGKALFRRRYDAYNTLKLFSNALVNILDLKDLNEKIISTLGSVLGVDEISVFLLDKEKNAYTLSASNIKEGEEDERAPVPQTHLLVRYLQENDPILIKEEMEHWLETTPNEDMREVVSGLAMIRSELCIPLKNKEQLIGFLSLGHKINHSMYTNEDINLLSTLAQNAAIALDNAILYEDLKRQKMLMRRTDRMRSLETMAGGFAHEIRNPLTSIKTFVQLAPQRRDDEEFIGAFSKVVSEDVSRIERLIQEILDYARYMQPRLSDEDLNDVVESSLYFIGVKADGRGITIEKSLEPDLPRVLIDRQQIKQVLLNLFLNALDSMGNGGKLVVKTHLLDRGTEGGWVQIEIGDTGSGITTQDLEHIFDPFFTTKHESAEREGTGLGLSIVHQIVQEHRGFIEVESRVKEGTTFYVTLPVNPIRHERRTERLPVS